VLYEALTGRCPFPGETPVAVAMAIVAGEYPPLDEVRPGLDPALLSTVQRAMATDPTQRFESAEAMAAALVARDPTVAMVDDVTLVHAVAPATAVLDHPVLKDTAEVGLAPPPPPVGRRRSRAPLAAVLAALALVVLLVAVLNRGDGGAPNQPVSAQTETTQPATTVARSQSPATTVAPARSATTAPAVSGNTRGGDKDAGKDDDKGSGKGKDKDD
jgi:hypothetical protein